MVKSLTKKQAMKPASVAPKKAKCAASKSSKVKAPKKSRKTSIGPATTAPATPQRRKAKTRQVPKQQTTPSTVSSKSTTQSKRNTAMMKGLALDSPSSSKKQKKSPPKEAASLCDTVNFADASTIDWLSREGVLAALEHFYEDPEIYEDLDYSERIIKLVTEQFSPADIRPCLQGILQEAGKDWRSIKVNRLKTNKAISVEFAKACVEISNARADLDLPNGVPDNIVVKEEKINERNDQ